LTQTSSQPHCSLVVAEVLMSLVLVGMQANEFDLESTFAQEQFTRMHSLQVFFPVQLSEIQKVETFIFR
jgi:hypothetical protein